MKINYRSITNNDFPFLKKVYRSTREAELDVTGWTEEEKVKFIEFQFNAQHIHYTNAYEGAELNVILINNVSAGRLYIWRTAHQIRIMDIALLPEFQNNGAGTKILKTLIEESEKTSKKLNIHVEYYNRALKLYERLGFKKVDDTGVYYFMERLPDKQ